MRAGRDTVPELSVRVQNRRKRKEDNAVQDDTVSVHAM